MCMFLENRTYSQSDQHTVYSLGHQAFLQKLHYFPEYQYSFEVDQVHPADYQCYTIFIMLIYFIVLI